MGQGTPAARGPRVDTALELGLEVTVAVGDFDSVTSGGLAAVEAAGARVERHPPEKDATDLELALDTARNLGAERIVVVGDPGGRLDHLLAGLLLLGARRYGAIEIDALLGPATVHIVSTERTLSGEPGELISLVPLHGPVVGVVTEGLRYPLNGETLGAGSSRGVSNVFTGPVARVAVAAGVLAAVRPGTAEGSP
ncbi:MAG: thiamine diphosphokinase [Actinobacteria bacterium]|nr:MAG: thiamine diphosphokinase [Actinomycetota bacterium]